MDKYASHCENLIMPDRKAFRVALPPSRAIKEVVCMAHVAIFKSPPTKGSSLNRLFMPYIRPATWPYFCHFKLVIFG